MEYFFLYVNSLNCERGESVFQTYFKVVFFPSVKLLISYLLSIERNIFIMGHYFHSRVVSIWVVLPEILKLLFQKLVTFPENHLK